MNIYANRGSPPLKGNPVLRLFSKVQRLELMFVHSLLIREWKRGTSAKVE